MTYREHVLKTGQRLAAIGFPTTCVHSGNLDLIDSTVEITGTDYHVQVCLHGDYVVGKVLPEGQVRFWDCPTMKDVIERLVAEQFNEDFYREKAHA